MKIFNICPPLDSDPWEEMILSPRENVGSGYEIVPLSEKHVTVMNGQGLKFVEYKTVLAQHFEANSS